MCQFTKTLAGEIRRGGWRAFPHAQSDGMGRRLELSRVRQTLPGDLWRQSYLLGQWILDVNPKTTPVAARGSDQLHLDR